MKQKRTLFAATGIPSLFLIFGVLCLSVLSLLTLGSSRSALSSARLSMEQTEQYYNACETASDQIAQIQNCLVNYYKSASGEDDYYTAVDRLSNEISGITVDAEEHTVQFFCEFSDTQELSVKLQILYPSTKEDTFLDILEWKTATTDTWNPDNSQVLYNKQEEQ